MPIGQASPSGHGVPAHDFLFGHGKIRCGRVHTKRTGVAVRPLPSLAA